MSLTLKIHCAAFGFVAVLLSSPCLAGAGPSTSPLRQESIESAPGVPMLMDPALPEWFSSAEAEGNGSIQGIAKGAKIISVLVFNENVSSNPLRASRGVNWCVDHAEEYNISVITTSMGGTGYLFENHCDQYFQLSLTPEIAAAAAKGISVTASAGNYTSDTHITVPACLSTAIPASNSNKRDTYHWSTCYNSLVKLFAPGVNITTTCYGGTHCPGTGTSYSSPHTAGAIAILNQLNALLGNEQSDIDPKGYLEPLLHQTGEPVNELPHGDATRINVYNAAMAMIADAQAILGDLNGDSVVNVADLMFLISQIGTCVDCGGCPAGLNDDCSVNATDLLLLLANWG